MHFYFVDFDALTEISINISRILNDTNLVEFYKTVTNFDDSEFSRSGSAEMCNSPKQLGHCQCYGANVKDKIKDLKDDLREHNRKIQDLHDRMSTSFSNIQETVMSLDTAYQANIKPLIKQVSDYRDGVLIKEAVATTYDDILTVNKMDSVIIYGTSLMDRSNKIRSEISSLEDSMVDMHMAVFDSNIPFITINNYNDTQMGRMLDTFRTDAIYQSYFNDFSTDFSNSYIGLIKAQYSRTRRSMVDMISSVQLYSQSLVTSMDILKTALTRYKISLEMDSQFYM